MYMSFLYLETNTSSMNEGLHLICDTIGKRGVRIGGDYVLYNSHSQKMARAERRERLSQKRGQLRMYSTFFCH